MSEKQKIKCPNCGNTGEVDLEELDLIECTECDKEIFSQFWRDHKNYILE